MLRGIWWTLLSIADCAADPIMVAVDWITGYDADAEHQATLDALRVPKYE